MNHQPNLGSGCKTASVPKNSGNGHPQISNLAWLSLPSFCPEFLQHLCHIGHRQPGSRISHAIPPSGWRPNSVSRLTRWSPVPPRQCAANPGCGASKPSDFFFCRSTWRLAAPGARRAAVLGICTLLSAVPDDVGAYPHMRTIMHAVVAPTHPLVQLGPTASAADLPGHVQLILSDPAAPKGPNFGLTSPHVWRFADLNRRLDFLMAGFGWCRMPAHVTETHLADGSLERIEIEDDTAPPVGIVIHAAHLRDPICGPATRLLLEALQGPPRDIQPDRARGSLPD